MKSVAEIIAEQKRKCEASKKARKAPPPPSPKTPPAPKKPPRSAMEKAYIEDRTYDGKTPDGNMTSLMHQENPGEYVGRDGTKTFCPWRYVSMQDLELPDHGNPYRKPEEPDNPKKMVDPWGRPSGYVASAAGPAMSPEYDPWLAAGAAPAPQQNENMTWDDWLAPATPAPPPPPPPPPAPAADTMMNGTLDVMRSMRK